MRAAERAGQRTTVAHGDVASQRREVDVGLRPRRPYGRHHAAYYQTKSIKTFLHILKVLVSNNNNRPLAGQTGKMGKNRWK